MLTLFFFIFGTCIGSFLNVVIYRLPLMVRQGNAANNDAFNLMVPRSHCLKCGATLSASQLIPVISWLIQGGRCRRCAHSISCCYPLLEVITGLLFAAVFACWHSVLPALALCLCLSALLALAAIDLSHMLLPDAITLPLLWCGLLWSTTGTGLVSAESAILGAASGYLSLWVTYWCYRLLRKREGMGYGDFKLIAALGAWLGAESINFILLLGPLLGCVYWLAFRFKKSSDNFPFGPALIIAGLIWLFLQAPIMCFIHNNESLSRIFLFFNSSIPYK